VPSVAGSREDGVLALGRTCCLCAD
jgi:TolB-like protein